MSVRDRYRRAFEESVEARARWASGKAFVRLGSHSGRVACAEPGCQRAGYNGVERPLPWQHACLLGHAPCPGGCGRAFPLKWDGTPRAHGHHRHVCPGLQ